MYLKHQLIFKLKATDDFYLQWQQLILELQATADLCT